MTFIELTSPKGKGMLINMDNVDSIEINKNGDTIVSYSNNDSYFFVKESISEIKALLDEPIR